MCHLPSVRQGGGGEISIIDIAAETFSPELQFSATFQLWFHYQPRVITGITVTALCEVTQPRNLKHTFPFCSVDSNVRITAVFSLALELQPRFTPVCKLVFKKLLATITFSYV